MGVEKEVWQLHSVELAPSSLCQSENDSKTTKYCLQSFHLKHINQLRSQNYKSNWPVFFLRGLGFSVK